MTSTHTVTGSGDEAVARAVWDRVERGLIIGLTHEFGNSAHAVEMLRATLEPGVPVVPEIIEAFREEGSGYSRLVTLYRMLPIADAEAPEAGTVHDAVSLAAELLGHHADARDAICEVHVPADVPAIQAPPTALIQSLVMALACSIRPGSAETTPSMKATGTTDFARIEVSLATEEPQRLGDVATGARWMLRTTRATVEASHSGGHGMIVFTLPSLARARRDG